ncbi:MAG: hypothetical protein H6736_23345 [Alphaproteobacteria bacterium]|nr:hypothetical protein [Alphaproteobacteria bacterium]
MLLLSTLALAGDFDGPADAYVGLLRESYAYVERSGFDVDAQLRHTRERAAAAADEEAFRLELYRGSLAFTDPHLLIGPLRDVDPNVVPTSSDLRVARRDGTFVVLDVRAGSPADLAGVRPGWKVLTVGGEAVEAAVQALWAGAVLAGTAAQWDYAATLVVNGRRTGDRELRFGTPKGKKKLVLGNPRDFASTVRERPPVEVARDGDLAVVRLNNQLGDRATIAAVDAAIAEVADAPAVVVDLRNTPSGGNTDVARALLGHFVDAPSPYQMHTIPEVERVTTVPRRFVEYVEPRAPRVTGKVAVLGGAWTGSMGEGIVIGFDALGVRTFASDMGDLRGALGNTEVPGTSVWVELGVEALFHVDGTPRADFVADVPLESADRDAIGSDPGMAAVRAWLTSGSPR